MDTVAQNSGLNRNIERMPCTYAVILLHAGSDVIQDPALCRDFCNGVVSLSEDSLMEALRGKLEAVRHLNANLNARWRFWKR